MGFRKEKIRDYFLLDTSVENMFINEYMASAPGDFVKIYLFALMYCGLDSDLTNEDIARHLNLDIEDVNLNRGVLCSNHAKKIREIPLSSGAIRALHIYISGVRNEMLLDKSEKALFVNVGGVRMSRQGFWKLLKHYQQSAGIPGEITPHTLRHSFAVHRLEEGEDLRSLQELMGHSGRSSTQVYSHMVKSPSQE